VRQQRGGVWQDHTWARLHDDAAAFAAGLRELGLERGDRVGLFLPACVEGLVALLGAQGAGLVPFGIYPGTPPETVAFLLETTDAKAVVLGDGCEVPAALAGDRPEAIALGTDWDRLLVGGRRRHIAQAGEWEHEVAQGSPGEVSTIYFTSGTTGRPKGVMLSCTNLLTAGYFDHFSEPPGLLPAPRGDDRTFHEIPLASVAGPVFGIYYPLVFGCTAYIPERFDDTTAALREASPTIFLTFPRMWEMRASDAAAAVAARPAPLRAAYSLAMAVRERTAGRRQAGRGIPPLLRLADRIARRTVCRPLLEGWGFADLRLVLTGGATLPPELIRTWRRWGVVIRQIYGQTESGGLATIQTEPYPQPGNAGRPGPRLEVRLDVDGEILVRGEGGLFLGYLDRPDATAEAMDPEGWLHTGDVGAIEPDGNLRVFDRKSDLITLESGDVVVASEIESVLKRSPYVRNAVVVGEGLPGLYGLIELDPGVAQAWARRRHLAAEGYEALVAEPQVRDLIDGELASANEQLAREGRAPVRAVRLLPREIDVNDPTEMTATRKVRRRELARKHQPLVDEMAAGAPAAR